MKSIAVIDCGIGNLRSVQKSLERLGVKAPISADAGALNEADAAVLPGVGAFGDAIGELQRKGLDRAIADHVQDGKPLLGICLGMQLLAKESGEGGRHSGLGLIDATVKLFNVAGQKDWAGRRLTLPHIGWNSVHPRLDSVLFSDVPPRCDYYFVHSYHVVCADPGIAAATANYGGPFTCAIEQGQIFAVQFHPEKSQTPGENVLRNFVSHVERRAAKAA